MLGDTKFFQAIKNYQADPMLQYGSSLTDDVKRHMENVTGLDLATFFNQWIYNTGFANYNAAKWNNIGQQLILQGDPARGIPACVQCHGSAMTGVAPNVPGLLGLPRDYLNAQLGAWKTGKRRAHTPDCMKAVVALLSDEDINAASSYLVAQPLPANTRPASSAPPWAAGQTTVNCGSAARP